MRYLKWMYFRWALVVFFVGGVGILTAWLLFIPAWVLRFLGKWNPLWLWMDDTRLDKTRPNGYAADYSVELDRRGLTKENFKVAYYWHVSRNRVWNLKELFKVPKSNLEVGNNDIIILKMYRDELYKNDESKTKVDQYSNWVQMAGLKYIPMHPDQDIWQVNKGDEISIRTSILGTGFFEYADPDQTWNSWRFSQCKIVTYKILWITIWKGYRTIKIGTNGSRYADTLKHQRIKPWA